MLQHKGHGWAVAFRLQQRGAGRKGLFTRTDVSLALVFVMVAVGAYAAGSAQARADAAIVADVAESRDHATTWASSFIEPDAGRDLYGNDVGHAVATYTLDDDGELYEEHFPQTELPRLAAPEG